MKILAINSAYRVEVELLQEFPNTSFVWYSLEGDNGAMLSNIEQTLWADPFLGFTHAGLQQINEPTQAVPEPAAMLLLASGLLGLSVFKRKKMM